MNETTASVGVLFTELINHKTKKPFEAARMNKAYSYFIQKANKKRIQMYVACYKSYRKGGILRYAWYYSKGWKKIENIKVNFIYNRSNKALFDNYKKNRNREALKYEMIKDLTVLNHPILEEFCWDKSIIHEIFPKYTPKTFLINTKKGLKTVLSEIPSDKIILKPRYGTLGDEVQVIDKNEIKQIKVKKNTIVQEFIESSNGIRGITNKRHDLRIIIINGKIDHCHVRIPKKGLLTANMAKGGTKKFVKIEHIPQSALRAVRKVDNLLKNFYPRLYSIDFIFDKNQKPYIVECNSSPTMHRYLIGKYKRMSYINRFLDMVKAGIMIEVMVTV